MLMVGTIQYIRDKKWEIPMIKPALNALFPSSLYKERISGIKATHASQGRSALGNDMVNKKPLNTAGVYSEIVVRKCFIAIMDVRLGVVLSRRFEE
ncbi:MAG: hypothetical protein HQK65_11675 [Desulfamplus sp.]|nr:hypothetical protein [Desulfamplus sp.]